MYTKAYNGSSALEGMLSVFLVKMDHHLSNQLSGGGHFNHV